MDGLKQIGSWSLAASGAAFTAGIALRGQLVAPGPGAGAAFAGWAGGAGFVPGFALILVATILLVIGFVDVERRIGGRVAYAGLLAAVAGSVALAALFGFILIAFPAAAAQWTSGNHSAYQLVVDAFASREGMALQLLPALMTIGTILFAVSAWRSGRLPRWATIGVVLYTILTAITAVVWFELAGSIVLLAAGVGIGLAPGQPADDRLPSGSSIDFRHGSSEPL